MSLDTIASNPKVIEAFERARDRIDLADFFGAPMGIEVQVEVVLKLADARAILDAARPFVGSIRNAATKKLADALKPLDAAVDPILEALTGAPPPTEPPE